VQAIDQMKPTISRAMAATTTLAFLPRVFDHSKRKDGTFSREDFIYDHKVDALAERSSGSARRTIGYRTLSSTRTARCSIAPASWIATPVR
jgi:hypothetical protein